MSQMLTRLLAIILSIVPAAEAVVYFGKVDGAKKPAELTAKTVFNEIPEYKKIKDKGLGKDDAEYWLLLNKANDKFNKAVKKVAEDGKYDVVVEKGSQKFDSTPADLTQKVIDALKK